MQVAVAKIQQNLPELKRDGNNVMASQSVELLYNKSSSNRASTVLAMMEFIPRLSKDLQDKPDEILKTFEQIREYGGSRLVKDAPIETDLEAFQ